LAHVQETLPQNLLDNPTATFVLLDYGDEEGLADYIQKDARYQIAIHQGRLAFYQFRDASVFKMAHAKNMAHRCAILEGGEILCNLDADNFTGPGFADYLDYQFTRTAKDPQEIFMWSRMMKGQMDRGISGRMAVTKDAFLISGGYNEKYETHSPDDKDFNVRLRRMGFCATEIDSKYLHAINHTDKMRFKDYPEILLQNAYTVEKNICPFSTVVNFGDVGCGTVYRNFDETEIEIKPFPTRIFGVGLHKTATTSLHGAFQLLGFKSGHWNNAHWSKAVWNQMSSAGRSFELEKFYALSDLPFPVLFEELDKSYPGSKFILTTRDEGAWLTSVQKHFRPKFNKFAAGWETDPFTSKIHKIIYGQKTFEWDLFLNKYRIHNARVINHFKDRPNDLLVMNMSLGAGWKELCGFLKMPVPPVDYPSNFKTASNAAS
jgi:Sulfotransferase domain